MPIPDCTDEIVIVGAGPAGSATAIHLARAGHRVTLLDRARFPRDKPCSEYLSPETVRHLATLGVLAQLEAHPHTALEGTRVRAADGATLLGRFARAGGTPFRPTGLAIARRILDATLVEAAREAGVRIQEGVTVTALGGWEDGGRALTLRDTDGALRTHTARCVVGADGLRSIVARQAGMRRQGRLRRVAFVAHLSGVTGLDRLAELHVGRSGYVGLNPLGDGVTNVALVCTATAAAAARGDAAGYLFTQIREFPQLRERLADAELVREVMVTGPFDASCRRSVVDGVLLVGDAADFFDPFTGEGVCSALAGGAMAAEVLAEALADGRPLTARRLAGYRHARRRAFGGKWVIERMIGHAMTAPRLFDHAVGRLERRGMADTLIGVTGQFVSPWRVLNPWFLGRMVT